jgi:hypothetical protein
MLCDRTGLGASAEPLATLAASAIGLSGSLQGLFPGVVAVSLLAAYVARGPSILIAAGNKVLESPFVAVMQGVRIFAFIAGLTFIGEACALLAIRKAFG